MSVSIIVHSAKQLRRGLLAVNYYHQNEEFHNKIQNILEKSMTKNIVANF